MRGGRAGTRPPAGRCPADGVFVRVTGHSGANPAIPDLQDANPASREQAYGLVGHRFAGWSVRPVVWLLAGRRNR